MKALRAFFEDGRRSQRGSVLSGVLIITAFLAIISGALMTTLSTNFLLSRNLMNRVANQATVNSAMELALDTIQHAPLNSACPNLASMPSLNGRNAVVSYLSCALVGQTDRIPTSSAVGVDATYVPASLVPGGEYLVVNSAGTLFGYPFGQTAGWSYSTGGTPTASPLAMSDGNSGVSDLTPTSYSNPQRYAVALARETTPGQAPTFSCDMVTDGSVRSTPAASRNPQHVAYVGDSAGALFAFDASATGACAEWDERIVAAGQPIVAGPIVFPGTTSSSDRLFLVASDNSSSSLYQYRYSGSNQKLTLMSAIPLPYANVVGMAADTTNGPPARLAITFSGGQLALVHVSGSFNMSFAAQTSGVPGGGVIAAPTWCAQCWTNGSIGVGSQSGLYVFDSNLNLYASYTGTAMPSSPAVDLGGDWFARGDRGSSGVLYELRPGSQGQMIVANAFAAGSAGISSAPVLHACGTSLCIYVGSGGDPHTYLVTLDGRDAILSACLTNEGSSSCSGVNPRLWARVEIGRPGNPQAVRVQGFSYYSP